MPFWSFLYTFFNGHIKPVRNCVQDEVAGTSIDQLVIHYQTRVDSYGLEPELFHFLVFQLCPRSLFMVNILVIKLRIP